MAGWLSLLIPIAYLGVMVGSIVVFSNVYRRRKAQKAASLAPWFGPHMQRSVYATLAFEETDGDGKVPESLLKAALLRRATEDVRRVLSLRGAKGPLQQLQQRGSVSDDLVQRFQRAEREMEEELQDVVRTADSMVQGWGQTIFQSASEINGSQPLTHRIDDLPAEIDAEVAWWEKRRTRIQTELMRELDGATASEKAPVPQPAPAPAPVPTPAATATPVAEKTKTSDDDGVMVEGGGPAVGQPASAKKKKKTKAKA